MVTPDGRLELKQLYQADQADRRNLSDQPGRVAERDRARRQRAATLIASIAAPDADDFFRAAMIFQHGEQLADYWRAHELALRAADMGHSAARWLAAAAYDRWLMQQGRPQKYGTQFRFDGERMALWEVDPATTDQQRAEWRVPPLAEARRQAERIPMVGPKPLARLKGRELEVWIWPAPPDAPAPHQPPTELVSEVPPGHPAMWGWRPGDGQPVLEAMTVADREAVLITGFADGRIALVLRASSDRCLFLTDRSQESILARARGLLIS